MHGHDLTPLLEDPEYAWPYPVLATLTARKYGRDTDVVPTDPAERDLAGVPWWVSLRHGKYKYIRTLVEGEIQELYDLDADPEELNNLALDADYVDVVRRFRAAQIAELKRTGAGFAGALPDVAPLVP